MPTCGWHGRRSASASRRQAVLLRVLGNLDKASGREALDSFAACLISTDVVPTRGLRVFGCVVENLDHSLREADAAAFVKQCRHGASPSMHAEPKKRPDDCVSRCRITDAAFCRKTHGRVMDFNKNDPAWKLCEAAQAALNGDLDAIDRVFDEVKPTAKSIAMAYALCLMANAPFQSSEANRLIIGSLQYRLTEETTRKLNVLTWWLVVPTVILALLAIVDSVTRWHCSG
jgi:hypothetical protein